MASTRKRAQRYMTLDERHDLIKYIQSHPAASSHDINAAFPHLHLAPNTISKYRKKDRQESVILEWEQAGSGAKKKQRLIQGQFHTIEHVMVAYIKDARKHNKPLTDELIIQKAADVKNAIIHRLIAF